MKKSMAELAEEAVLQGAPLKRGVDGKYLLGFYCFEVLPEKIGECRINREALKKIKIGKIESNDDN